MNVLMHNAAAAGDVVTIRRLVAEGADVNVPGDRALHLAAQEGHVDAVRVLMELGAGKEASAADGWRPLHSAAYRGQVAVVKTLVELGADKETSAVDGMRALHTAAWHGHVAVLTTLVELGADIGALTLKGETPLQLNIRFGHHQAAQVLKELERSARTKKEAEAKKPTQHAGHRSGGPQYGAAVRGGGARAGRSEEGALHSHVPSPSSMALGWMVCPSHTG
jgi:ankyrin repeat protein